MNFVQEGDTVILDENGEKKTFLKIKKLGQARIGKAHLCTDPFLGAPFGAVFTLSADGKSMQRVSECPTGEWATQHIVSSARNNAELLDRNANQKLTAAEIAAMRASGKEGAEIVEALISNSATFESKTEFSQEKYRKKKTKKYVTNITLRQPTALTICQSYFEKGPARVFNLRPDSLGIMLSLANVAAGAKVMVMDACVGVVTAAIVERLGGLGHVCSVHLDKPFSTDSVKLLNLTPQQQAVRCSSSLDALQEAKALGPEWLPSSPAVQQSSPHNDSSNAPLAAATAQEESNLTEQQQAQDQQHQGQKQIEEQTGKREAQAAKQLSLLHGLVHPGFNSCIIVVPRVDPMSLMEQVLPLLQPSTPFVIYSQWVQPLADCLHHLLCTHQAAMMQLHESWMRPYQVLPSRTHPQMTSSGTGGFILSGTKILPDEQRGHQLQQQQQQQGQAKEVDGGSRAQHISAGKRGGAQQGRKRQR